MKKYASIMWSVVLLLFMLLCFSACNTEHNFEETDNTTTKEITDTTHSDATDHTHTWGQWEIVKEATCLDDGEEERACDCGERETQSISATGHNFVDNVCSSCELLKESEGLKYSLNSEGGFYTVKGMGNCEDLDHLVIPSTRYGLPVTAIAEEAFENKIIKKVTLPEGITTIGDSAFENCHCLQQISLPESLVSIGNGAFKNCRELESIVIPSSVTDIGNGAFNNCRELESIVIPNSVTDIGNGVFIDCVSLSDITLPDSMTYIPSSMFAYCESLKSFTIPQGITVIKSSAFKNCCALKSVTLPPSLKQIENNAFNGAPIENVYLSDIAAWCGIEILGDTFGLSTPIKPNGNIYLNGEKITSLQIPDGVTAIGTRAFINAASLTEITISADVISIGDHAFYGCTGLKSIVIPDNVLQIGEGTFSRCTNLKNVTLSSNMTEIPANAFYMSGITSIKIGNSITNIGKSAFEDCTALQRVEIGDGLKTVGEYAFVGCTGLKGVYITDIANWCEISFDTVGPLNLAKNLYLNGVLVKDLQIPEGVRAIEQAAFWGCKSLESVSLPKSLEYIGAYAFNDCTGLKAVYITDMAAWCNVDISVGSANPLVYAGALYLNGELVTELSLPVGVTKVKQCAFTGCTSLLKVVIPDCVTELGAYAFSDCKNITELNVGGGIVNNAVSVSVFRNCTSLESVVLNEGITCIPMSWFNGCSALKTIVIPSSVKEIASYAFYGCTNLSNVVFTNTIGWKYETDGTEIDPEILSDSEDAAALLKKYATSKWSCS